MKLIRKVLLVALGALLLALAGLGLGGRTASAEVEANYWLNIAPSRDNPCEAGTNPVSLSGRAHFVWFTTPEGTLRMHIQGHLTGTDADGTEYIFNWRQSMEHFAWPSIPPYTDRVVFGLISKGSTVNALIVTTVDTTAVPPSVTVTACVGGG